MRVENSGPRTTPATGEAPGGWGEDQSQVSPVRPGPGPGSHPAAHWGSCAQSPSRGDILGGIFKEKILFFGRNYREVWDLWVIK